MVAVSCSVGVLHPRSQTRSLVVQKQSPVSHCRLPVGIFASLDVYLPVLLDRNVSPPIPRRHSHLFAQLVDAKHSASLVAACNHQLLPDGLDDIFLGLAFQVAQLATLHPLVYHLVASHGANQYIWLLSHIWPHASYFLHICLQTGHGTLHAAVLTVVEAYGGSLQGNRVSRRLEYDEIISCTDRHCPCCNNKNSQYFLHVTIFIVLLGPKILKNERNAK